MKTFIYRYLSIIELITNTLTHHYLFMLLHPHRILICCIFQARWGNQSTRARSLGNAPCDHSCRGSSAATPVAWRKGWLSQCHTTATKDGAPLRALPQRSWPWPSIESVFRFGRFTPDQRRSAHGKSRAGKANAFGFLVQSPSGKWGEAPKRSNFFLFWVSPGFQPLTTCTTLQPWQQCCVMKQTNGIVRQLDRCVPGKI